jgi:hypothetical protein
MCSLSMIVRTDQEREEEDVNALMADAYIATAGSPTPALSQHASCMPACATFFYYSAQFPSLPESREHRQPSGSDSSR